MRNVERGMGKKQIEYTSLLPECLLGCIYFCKILRNLALSYFLRTKNLVSKDSTGNFDVIFFVAVRLL